VERPMLARRRHDRAPAAAGSRVSEGNLGHARLELARLLAGPDNVERVVLERARSDTIARGQATVLAVAAVVNGLGRPGKAVAVECPIDDGRDPPAGRRVLAQLEQTRRHLSQSRA